MNTPAVMDDYLMDLLGDLGAATPQPAPVSTPEATSAQPIEARVASEPVCALDDAAELPSPALGEASDGDAADVADAAEAPRATLAALPALAIAPVRAGSEAELITDDEFEALLDQLHGSGAPAVVAAQDASAAAAVPPSQPSPASGGRGQSGAAHASVAPATPAPQLVPVVPLESQHMPVLPPAPHHVPAVSPAPALAAAPAMQVAPRAMAPLPAKPYLQAPIDSGERRRATERKTRWLRLRCDQQHYALELLKVQEVVRPSTLLPLRGAAHHMLGVMNLRGQVVPVIDMGLYLGRRPVETDASTRVVVLEENGETLGLRVTAVEDVANLTDQQIEPPDNARVGRITNPLFRGVARLQERAVILLDASHLLK